MGFLERGMTVLNILACIEDGDQVSLATAWCQD